MSNPALVPLTKEQCLEAVRLLEKNSGSKAAAAREAGVPVTTFKQRLKIAAKRGFLGFDPVLPGFAVAQISTTQDQDGNVTQTHIKQRQEAGEPFEVPAGHTISHISSLVGPDNATILKWIKTREDAAGTEDVVSALKATFDAYQGKAPILKAPRNTDKDTLTIYNVADHHLGLLAWKPEVGANYDLKIAEKFLKDTLQNLVASAPASELGIILNLGDFVHSDSNENRTRRSGAVLDVEGRYAKVLQIGVSLLIFAVELLLTKHKRVLLRNIPGNHDPYAALALSIALACFFHGNKRVTVDTSPSSFWEYRFGKVLLASTHGDMTKPEDIAGVVAAYWPKDWGETEFRYAYMGHVHHRARGGGEKAGLIWETFQSLTAKDSWHFTSGYASGRSMVAITHHKDQGEVSRVTKAVPRFEMEKV